VFDPGARTISGPAFSSRYCGAHRFASGIWPHWARGREPGGYDGRV